MKKLFAVIATLAIGFGIVGCEPQTPKPDATPPADTPTTPPGDTTTPPPGDTTTPPPGDTTTPPPGDTTTPPGGDKPAESDTKPE